MAQLGSYNSPLSVDSENQVVVKDLVLTAVAPASATAPGTKGEVVVVTGFVYTCTATNTWERVATATWV